MAGNVVIPGKARQFRARPKPDVAKLIGFDHAVAGHAGTLQDPDGFFFYKPTTAQEEGFYETTRSQYPQLYELFPKYYGCVELSAEQAKSIEEQGQDLLNKHTVPGSGHHAQGEPMHAPMLEKLVKTKKIESNRYLVLEAGTYKFKKPNTLDTKLGIRLYADDASAEKKLRFDKVTAETTHRDLGFRIAGMKVWQGHDEPRGGHVDKNGFYVYDKNYGREDVNVDNIVESFRTFLFEAKAGIDEELGQALAGAFLKEVLKMQEVLESMETRMYSASILFVYEGDSDALREAIAEGMESEDEREARLEKESERREKDKSEGDEDEDSDWDEPRPILSAKLIDFAHAFHVPGEGPDENMLKGIRSIVKILRELTGEEEVSAKSFSNGGLEKAGDVQVEAKAVSVNGTA